MAEIIKAKIENLTYRAGQSMGSHQLSEYPLDSFNINTAATSGIINVDSKNKVAYSKWVSPKRTRSYPFARIYDTYSFGGKRITIIPVIKDEGFGASKNKSNNDRINFITLSWMNLTNIFVILAWYTKAEKKSPYRITNQEFDSEYIRKKVKEISRYQFDAHHWNNEHFRNDFHTVYIKAVRAYEKIAKALSVKMHSPLNHLTFLEKIKDRSHKDRIDLERFSFETLAKSKLAAAREVAVKHQYEYLSRRTEKVVFELRNNLGGRYFLTADEVLIDSNKKQIAIQESKNATKGKLPKETDIKDGLFKILLFSHLREVHIQDTAYRCTVGLKLSGRISTTLQLPNEKGKIVTFLQREGFSESERNLVFMLNEEAAENDYSVQFCRN